MIARLQALAVLCWALAWMWPLQALAQGRWGAATAAALVLLLGHALWLALGFVLAHRANRQDPVPRARSGELLRAWWGEARAAPRVFGWQQPFRSQACPDRVPAHPDGRPGVLLVHGFLCNRGLWNPWMRRLRAQGVAHVALSLEPVFGDIDAYVPLIEAAVRRLEHTTGVPPVLVAHSMGGLAIRAWLRAHPADERVRCIITLGTPHQGTALAAWAVSENGRQMQPGGAWLQALAAQESAERRARFVCLYSHCDNIVYPASTACLPGARHEHVPAVAHVDLVSHPRAWAALQAALAG